MNTFRLGTTSRVATMLKREQNAATFKLAFDNGFYPVTWCPKSHVYWLYAIGLDASSGDGGKTWIDIDGDEVPVEDVRGLLEYRDLLFVDGPHHGFALPLYQ